MTRADKATRRLTYATARDRGKLREVVATVQGRTIELRLLGTRRRYKLDLGVLYDRAALAEARESVAARRKGRRISSR